MKKLIFWILLGTLAALLFSCQKEPLIEPGSQIDKPSKTKVRYICRTDSESIFAEYNIDTINIEQFIRVNWDTTFMTAGGWDAKLIATPQKNGIIQGGIKVEIYVNDKLIDYQITHDQPAEASGFIITP